MKIDLRILIPFAMPFAVLLVARLLWFCAGAEWSLPELGATISLIIGGTIGVVICGSLFAEDTRIGSITIGRAREK